MAISPYTAKSIKHILDALDQLYWVSGSVVNVNVEKRGELERALLDFADNLSVDAIEP